MDERLGRQARNEALVREVNERVGSIAGRAHAPEGDAFEFHCECGGEPLCAELVTMTLVEYDEVRGQDDRFALVPGHENLELERVVRRTDRYVVVDKLDEFEHLVADDPRGRPSE